MPTFRTLKLGLITLGLATMASCGGSKGGGDQTAPSDGAQPGPGQELAAPTGSGTGTSTASFTEVNAILTDHCVACHSDSDHPPHFIGHEDVTKQSAKDLIDVLTTTDPAKQMPRVRKTTAPLTDDEKSKIVAYANALKTPAAGAPTFDADIQPILTKACALCHADTGRAKPHFIGHRDVFDAAIADVVDRVTTTDKASVMPPAQSVPLSNDEKAKVVGYLQSVQ